MGAPIRRYETAPDTCVFGTPIRIRSRSKRNPKKRISGIAEGHERAGTACTLPQNPPKSERTAKRRSDRRPGNQYREGRKDQQGCATVLRTRKRHRMQLTTCCGCCSLKTGTIIIGVLGIVFTVFSLIVIFTLSDIEWETRFGLDRTTAEISFAIYYCIIILFCTLLVIGSIKKNTFMMLPWMILNMIIAVVLLVIIVYSTIVFIIYDLVFTADFRVVFIGYLVAIMLQMYQWLVVYSHFQELRLESRNCAQERVSTVNHIIIDDEGPARPRERSDPTSAISFT